jgi:hypothetical protein
MKKAPFVLALGLAVGVAANLLYYGAHQQFDPDSLDGRLAWMKSELNLSDAQYRRIRELHEESSPRLRALAAQVTQMQSEFAAFENARRTTDRVDFIEFARYVEARRAVSRECLESTRRLVFATADEMSPAQREHYFGIVAVTKPLGGKQLN